MIEQTIVDVLEQDDQWLRSDGSSVRVEHLDPGEAESILTSLRERASLLWFAAMWRADRRYVTSDVLAADLVSPTHWLANRPLVHSLERVVRVGARRGTAASPAVAAPALATA
jgi:hypothetical protein